MDLTIVPHGDLSSMMLIRWYSGTVPDQGMEGDMDPCPKDPKDDREDEDGICGDVDNCPAVANTDQADADADGLGDACDACPNDPDNDVDSDSLCADADNCPAVANVEQTDDVHDWHEMFDDYLADGGLYFEEFGKIKSCVGTLLLWCRAC